MSTVTQMSSGEAVVTHQYGARPAVLEKPMRTFSTGALTATFTESENGVRSYEWTKVFKSGTFKDSMGYQQTWEKEHLAQMVFNFTMLKEKKVLENVPVRDGHPGLFGSGGRVIGYVTELEAQEVDGNTFLMARFEITEPEDAAKIDRGTYRARSAEIGFFESNDEALYWPVFQGFAFVDIGAVEGLFEKAKPIDREGATDFAILFEKEKNVSDKSKDDQKETEQAPPPEQPAPPAPPAPSEPAPVGQPQAFRVNGAATSDFSAVQAHIDALETSIREMGNQARKDFVKSIADANLIPASKMDEFEKMALSMNDEQFGMFRATYAGAPEMPLLANHSTGSDGGAPPPSDENKTEDVNLEIVRQFQRAGRDEEWIKTTKAYRTLEAAGKAPAL